MLHRRLPRLLLSLALGAPLLAMVPGDSWILSILGISFLIFIHEWGHFTACRLTGTRTETFSIGFGPRLFGWEKDREGHRRFTLGRRQLDPAEHAMDFRVAAIPLGGYVKMAGELPGEGTGPGGRPAPDEFPGKSAWARIFIVCAGVLMNLVTAVVFYALAYGNGKHYTVPMVGSVANGGAAWHAGVRPGDRIVRVGDHETPTFTDLRMEIAFAHRDGDTPIVVERGGKRLTLAMRPVFDKEHGLLTFGVTAAAALELGPTQDGAAAFRIGPEDDVRVAGVPAHGGAQAFERLLSALDAGIYPVPIQGPDGTNYELAARPDPQGQAPASPGAKVGLVPYVRARVKAVRGSARGLLKAGDRILRVRTAGQERPVDALRVWQGLPWTLPLQAVVVERDGQETTVKVDLADAASVARFVGDVALDAKPDNRVTPLPAGSLAPLDGLWRYPSSPAAAAGVPSGARITRIGDHVIHAFTDIPAALADVQAGRPVPFRLAAADGSETTVSLVPVDLERVGDLQVTHVPYQARWHVGGPVAALGLGFARTGRETVNVFRTIDALFAGTISFNKNIAGPVRLVTASKEFAEHDFWRLVWFLAYVSVMLAVLNILPIPVLDGGQLMFILIEKIKGKPLSERTIYNLQKIGFLLLLVLMFFAFKNDFNFLKNS
jgi:regulator of sigma E protease